MYGGARAGGVKIFLWWNLYWQQLRDTFFMEVYARLCESPTASGTNVGDVIPGTPEFRVYLSCQ